MIIRAFICKWSSIFEGDTENITNPIIDFVDKFWEAPTKDDEITLALYHPDAKINGRPNKTKVLVIVLGPTTIESLGDIAGVKMLPAHSFQKNLTEIPANERAAARASIEGEGIPSEVLTGSAVYGDYLKKIAKHFITDFSSFGDHIEIDRSAEFS